jgi:hypothetical protein
MMRPVFASNNARGTILGMRVWRWFAASALWLGLIFAWTFDFHEGNFGGFGVGINTGKHLTPQTGFALAPVLLDLMLFGWVIPLCIGLWRLTLRDARGNELKKVSRRSQVGANDHDREIVLCISNEPSGFTPTVVLFAIFCPQASVCFLNQPRNFLLVLLLVVDEVKLFVDVCYVRGLVGA